MSEDGIHCIVNSRKALHVAVQQGYELTRRFAEEGRAVLVEIREADEITVRQRGFYHSYVLPTIAEHGRVNGMTYSFGTWKEYFREKNLGTRFVSYDVPGQVDKVTREERISTEDIGVRKYAKLISAVMAYGAIELGLVWQYKEMEEWETHGQLRRAV
jgi:hypothetical protein